MKEKEREKRKGEERKKERGRREEEKIYSAVHRQVLPVYYGATASGFNQGLGCSLASFPVSLVESLARSS